MILTVNTQTANRLIELNRQFYQTFALQFSETRQRVQPGVRRVLRSLPAEANLLDIGCGNGELLRELAAKNHRGNYTGIDFSNGLIEHANHTCSEIDFRGQARFIQADITQAGWKDLACSKRYEYILAFAVLHHIPGVEIRMRLLKFVRELLMPDGVLVFSVWQPLNNPRLSEHILPWTKIGLEESELDAGDVLMDWRHGGYGLRYVHIFSEGELVELAHSTGFTMQESTYSDGAGGRLGLYQIWKSSQP